VEQLRLLGDGSIHCVVTSPPYWGLRDYGVEGQIGLEPTMDEYIEKMVEVFREVRRVLRDDGTCWVNLGDAYAQSGGTMASSEHDEAKRRAKEKGYQGHGGREGRTSRAGGTAGAGLKPKDLCGIPWRVAFALQADGWYLRSDIVWTKPNPMPESVTDRPTKSHEYLFLLTKLPRYWYDAEAIREITGNEASIAQYEKGDGHRKPSGTLAQGVNAGFGAKRDSFTHPAGRNKRDVWVIPTQPYPEAHFATYPEALVKPCILAGCPHKVCEVCGAGWVRVVEKEGGTIGHSWTDHKNDIGAGMSQVKVLLQKVGSDGSYTRWTVGWRPTCTHDAETVPGTVLDPFLGSGTTAKVARDTGRRWVGIELSSEYAELAYRRIYGRKRRVVG